MAFSEVLRILIDADTRGAVRGIQQVGAVTDRELSRSKKNIDAWGRGLTTAGATMVALGGAALFGLGKAAMASEDANLAVVKLENTLANMPRLAGENSKSFIDLANSIQDKTAADADQIVAAEAMLGTFNLTGQEIRNITPLVVDYARKFGVDMVSASVQVGKALDGNVGALKRNGVSIDEVAFKTDRFGAVQKALADQVGGFAEAEGKTFAGSLERLKNQLGDVAEGVGVGAVDAFSDLFGIVEAGSKKLNDLSPATQAVIGKVATFGSVALVAAGGMSFMIGQLITMRKNFVLAQDAVVGFAGSGGLGRLARAGLVVGGLIAIREVLLALEDDLEGIDVSTLENDLLDLAETGKLSGGQLKDVFDGIADALESGDPQKVEAMADQLGEVDKALAQLAARDPAAAAAAFRFITDTLSDLGASKGQIKSFFDDYIAAVAGVDTASRTAAGGAEELGGAFGEQAGEVSAAQQALEEYSDSLKSMFDPLFGLTDALMDNQEAQANVSAAELELAAAQRDHGAASAEAQAAQEKLTEAQLAAGKSAVDVDLAYQELNAAVADQPALLGDAKAAIDGWVKQGLISKDTAAALKRQMDVTAESAVHLGRTDPRVDISERGGARTRGSLSAVQQAAINAGRQKPNVRVSTSGTGSAISNLAAVTSAVNRIPHSKTVRIGFEVYGVAELNRARALTGRQHGGPVRAGQAYVVGEHRPELFIPDVNGRIMPSVPGPATGSAWGGGYVDQRQINVYTGADPQQVVDALRKYERRNGSVPIRVSG